MLSQKRLEVGKFSKGVPLPPNTTHLHILIILYDLLLLVIQVFDLAINSIQVSLAFYLSTHKLHISLRIGERLRSVALERFQTLLRDLIVPSEELGQAFFSQNLENL